MKKLLFLFLSVSSFCLAEPRFQLPKTQSEIWQNDLDLMDEIRGNVKKPISRTLAQINAITPTYLGEIIYCSNCTNTVICASTATVVGSWSSPAAKGTHCN
jgi:hypothetical protein